MVHIINGSEYVRGCAFEAARLPVRSAAYDSKRTRIRPMQSFLVAAQERRIWLMGIIYRERIEQRHIVHQVHVFSRGGDGSVAGRLGNF